MTARCSFIIAAPALIAACGSRSTLDARGTSAATSTSTSTSASTASGTSTTSSGAGGGGGSLEISGHFMQPQIGNCINAEDWWSFGEKLAFVHTLVNRDFCGKHSVTPSAGNYFLDSATGVLSLSWAAEFRHYTIAILDPHQEGSGLGLPPGYAWGSRAINRMAYRRRVPVPLWHREEVVEQGGGDHTFSIDLTIDPPLTTPSQTVHCEITIAIAVTTSSGNGNESWTLPCTFQPTKGWPGARLTADGFEDSETNSKWYAFLEKQGIYQKYPSAVAGTFEQAMRPAWVFLPSDPATLFHDVGFGWYQEMKNPPPASVP